MSHISHLLITRIADSLEASMKTTVSNADPIKAYVVKPYRFQSDPVKNSIHISVLGSDPADTNRKDGRVTARDMEDLGMKLPSGEIGGGHLWWRRGRIMIGVYFIIQGYTEELAADYAYRVLGRVTDYTERIQVADLSDEFGERAHYLMVYGNHFYEGGGPTSQYLWRGEVNWQVLTSRPI